MSELDTFLSRCSRHPAALSPLKKLFADFNASLGPGHAGRWSRSNFIAALGRAGFALAEIGNSDVVVGLCPPSGGWAVKNGRLHFAESAP